MTSGTAGWQHDESSSMSADEYILFSVADTLCGLKISEVQEIKRVSEITPVHHAPPYVRGVINLRGQIVTILDICEKFNYQTSEIDTNMRIVIVKHEEESIGLLVDSIEDAITATQSQIAPPPSNINKIEGQYITGIYKTNDALIAILDKDRLLEKECTDQNSSAGAEV